MAAQAERQRVEFEEPFEFAGINECNGLPYVATGELQFFVQVVTTPSGESVVKAHTLSRGKVVDEEGNTYSFHGIINEEFPGGFSGGGPATFTGTQSLVSQGPEDNFFFQYVLHVNSDGELTVENVRVDCRG